MRDGENEIWIGYTFNFLTQNHDESNTVMWGVPLTWGDFVQQQGEGPMDDDTGYDDDTVPDIIFWSPGYHATQLTSDDYGVSVGSYANALTGSAPREEATRYPHA